MVNERAKRVAIIDFGYSTHLEDDLNPLNYRNGVQNLMVDLESLPDFVGLNSTAFNKTYKGVYDNVKKQAREYSSSPELYELAIKRYHDVLEREIMWDDKKPRSKFVSGADQPRIPGLTRRILTANANTFQRQVMEQVHGQNMSLFAKGARNLGLKPANLFMALRPERQARFAARKAQRPLTTRRGQRPFTVPPQAQSTKGWED
jgi:hypothetical protein